MNKFIIRMNQAIIFICNSLFILSNSSCAIWKGLDPAESLAYQLASEAKRLNLSDGTSIEFEFIPDEMRLKESPFHDEFANLVVHPDKKIVGESVIQFNQWFVTSYHSREVVVYSKLKKTHDYGEPFVISLKKKDGKIVWTEIK